MYISTQLEGGFYRFHHNFSMLLAPKCGRFDGGECVALAVLKFAGIRLEICWKSSGLMQPRRNKGDWGLIANNDLKIIWSSTNRVIIFSLSVKIFDRGENVVVEISKNSRPDRVMKNLVCVPAILLMIRRNHMLADTVCQFWEASVQNWWFLRRRSLFY